MPTLKDRLRAFQQNKADRSAKRRSSRSPVLFLCLFLAFWSLLTGLFDAVIAFGGYRQWRATTFPTAPATITHSEIESSSDSDGTTYSAEVSFDYEVAGRTYTSDAWRYGAWGSSDQSESRAVVERFPVGAQTVAYYDPDDPASAVLVTGVQGSDLFLILFMLPFNGVMLGGWYALIRYRLWRWNGPGGLRLSRTYHGDVLHLPRMSPLLAGIITAGLGGFVSIFAIGFTKGFTPSLTLAGSTLTGILALAGLVFVGTLARNLAKPRRLIVDTHHARLTLPPPHDREPIPFDRVTAVDVAVTNTGKRNENGVPIFRPTLHYTDDHGQSHAVRVGALATPARAEAVTAWLRERLGLGDPAAAPARR